MPLTNPRFTGAQMKGLPMFSLHMSGNPRQIEITLVDVDDLFLYDVVEILRLIMELRQAEGDVDRLELFSREAV